MRQKAQTSRMSGMLLFPDRVANWVMMRFVRVGIITRMRIMMITIMDTAAIMGMSHRPVP
ncbi:MAG: hypothetical protein BWY82_02580 [Verrucomicrobia bacterium ADurb.Bin474]|nr:MAG: hypothetical protein BWY82_02580 [Verrucomicrobia bacterium ADurb.Bin474]